MKNRLINRIVWTVGAMVALLVCYVLSRHDVLGQWHNMYDWPLILLVFGLIVLAIAAFIFSKKVMLSIPAGYLIGFILATIFNADGFDQGGGATNNGWIIWTISYMAIIVSGAIWALTSYCLTKWRK